jgi:NADH-quinone oxidoreductase subunit N
VLKGQMPNANPLLAIIGLVLAGTVALFANSAAIPPLTWAGSIRTDTLSVVANVVLVVAGVLSVLVAWTYLKNRGLDHGEYYGLLLLATSGAMLMACGNDLVMLFLGLEILSFALYVLAGFARTEARSEEASIKYFLLGAFASAFLLFGIALVYGATRTTNLTAISDSLHAGNASGPMLAVGIALLIVGVGFKAALFPFHQWTPDVYVGAPTSATAFMAATAKIGAFAAALRIFEALAPVGHLWLQAVAGLAVLTMVFGNVFAVTQDNVKRMLAYSSIAHAGYLLVAVVAFTQTVGKDSALAEAALGSALFYLLAYTFMTLGAFGVLIYLSGRGRDYQTIYDLRGLVRHDPLAAYAMLFFMLSLGGVPPTMGFMGKLQIFYAGIQAGQIGLAIVLALTSVIAAYPYLRVVWMMCFEESQEGAPEPPVARGGARATLLIAGAATLLFGVLPGLLTGLTTFKP